MKEFNFSKNFQGVTSRTYIEDALYADLKRICETN